MRVLVKNEWECDMNMIVIHTSVSIMLINDIHNEQFNTIQVVVYVIIDVCAGA
jgi:hypothetical protein